MYRREHREACFETKIRDLLLQNLLNLKNPLKVSSKTVRHSVHSALVHNLKHVEYLSVEFMRTCPSEQPVNRRQFIHGKQSYSCAGIEYSRAIS